MSDLADVFVLLSESEFVRTNCDIIEELFWGKEESLEN